MKHGRSIGLGLAVLLSGPGLAAAQQQPPRWEPQGLDITPNGGWRMRAREVAAVRARLLELSSFATLNAAPAGPAAVNAVVGTLRVPVIMFRYQDSSPDQYSNDTAQYNAALFATTPPLARPYTLRTFYEQMSNGLFSIQGSATGWEPLSGNESAYTGMAGTCFENPYGTNNCNGVWSWSAFAAMQNGLREALDHADSAIDFGQFDNDGPDGIPNSSDDDGVVDAVLFLHPSMDGACLSSTNNHLWSHRSSISDFTTNDVATPGPRKSSSHVIVRDYILQSGLGSTREDGSPCDSTAIMPIGSVAHELGHVLALPDLYDVTASTAGIGEYGLMGSGNYTTGNSPSRYDAWSLQQMGWTTIQPLTTTGTYTVGPVPTADTVFYLNVQGTNLNNEYFLIENRQEVQSDSAMLRVHCDRSGNPLGCGGGLLIYHIDGSKACLLTVCANYVNSGPIHGVVVEEADGLRQMWNGWTTAYRGDGGDPYPGTTNNTVFSLRTDPAAVKNLDTTFAGFAIDSIRQLVPNGAMAFRLRFGQPTVVAASVSGARVQVDGVPYTVFRDLLDDGSTHMIAVADTQFTAGGRARFVFQSWSDGQPASHNITGSLAGATYTATLARANRLDVAKSGSGSVAFNPVADTSGVFVPQGTAVTLTATANAPSVFGGWQGDTATSNAVLVLPMGRPYSLTAVFDPQLAITTSGTLGAGIVGNTYAHALQASGGSGSYSWLLASGALPSGLVLTQSGLITGKPTAAGTFVFTVRVTSGPQQAQLRDSITVTAPTLALADVLGRLLTGAGALGASDTLYLDFIGNQNGGYDVGDFLAWVRLTGSTPASAPAGRPAAVARKRGRP